MHTKMPKNHRLPARGQATQCSKSHKPREQGKEIPLVRKSTSVLSFKNTKESKPTSSRRKELKSVTYSANPLNEGKNPIPLKSCISSQKHSDKIKMKVKFYLKKGDDKFRFATHTNSVHEVSIDTKKRKEVVTTQQQSEILNNNKIILHRGGMAGDSACIKLDVKPKYEQHHDKTEGRIRTSSVKKSLAKKIKTLIIEKNKQLSDTSLRRRRKSINLREYNSYLTIPNYDKFEQELNKSDVKNQTSSRNKKDNSLNEKCKGTPIKYTRRPKICDRPDMSQKNVQNIPNESMSTIFKNQKSKLCNLDEGNSHNNRDIQRNSSENTNRALSAVVYQDICVTGRKLRLWKNHPKNKKRRVLSIKIGRQSSRINIINNSDDTSKNCMKYYCDKQSVDTTNSTISGAFTHMAKDVMKGCLKSNHKLWESKKNKENIKKKNEHKCESATVNKTYSFETKQAQVRESLKKQLLNDLMNDILGKGQTDFINELEHVTPQTNKKHDVSTYKQQSNLNVIRKLSENLPSASNKHNANYLVMNQFSSHQSEYWLDVNKQKCFSQKKAKSETHQHPLFKILHKIKSKTSEAKGDRTKTSEEKGERTKMIRAHSIIIKPENSSILATPEQTSCIKTISKHGHYNKSCCCQFPSACKCVKIVKERCDRSINVRPSTEISNKQVNTASLEALQEKEKYLYLANPKQTQTSKIISRQELNNSKCPSSLKIIKIEDQESNTSLNVRPCQGITNKRDNTKGSEAHGTKIKSSPCRLVSPKQVQPTKADQNNTITLKPSQEIMTTMKKSDKPDKKIKIDDNQLNAHKQSNEPSQSTKKGKKRICHGLSIGNMPLLSQNKSTKRWRVGTYHNLHDKHQQMVSIDKQKRNKFITTKTSKEANKNQNGEDIPVKFAKKNRSQQTNTKSLWSKFLKAGKGICKQVSQHNYEDTSKTQKRNRNVVSQWFSKVIKRKQNICNECKKPCPHGGKSLNKRDSKQSNSSVISECLYKRRQKKKDKTRSSQKQKHSSNLVSYLSCKLSGKKSTSANVSNKRKKSSPERGRNVEDEPCKSIKSKSSSHQKKTLSTCECSVKQRGFIRKRFFDYQVFLPRQIQRSSTNICNHSICTKCRKPISENVSSSKQRSKSECYSQHSDKINEHKNNESKLQPIRTLPAGTYPGKRRFSCPCINFNRRRYTRNPQLNTSHKSIQSNRECMSQPIKTNLECPCSKKKRFLSHTKGVSPEQKTLSSSVKCPCLKKKRFPPHTDCSCSKEKPISSDLKCPCLKKKRFLRHTKCVCLEEKHASSSTQITSHDKKPVSCGIETTRPKKKRVLSLIKCACRDKKYLPTPSECACPKEKGLSTPSECPCTKKKSLSTPSECAYPKKKGSSTPSECACHIKKGLSTPSECACHIKNGLSTPSECAYPKKKGLSTPSECACHIKQGLSTPSECACHIKKDLSTPSECAYPKKKGSSTLSECACPSECACHKKKGLSTPTESAHPKKNGLSTPAESVCPKAKGSSTSPGVECACPAKKSGIVECGCPAKKSGIVECGCSAKNSGIVECSCSAKNSGIVECSCSAKKAGNAKCACGTCRSTGVRLSNRREATQMSCSRRKRTTRKKHKRGWSKCCRRKKVGPIKAVCNKIENNAFSRWILNCRESDCKLLGRTLRRKPLPCIYKLFPRCYPSLLSLFTAFRQIVQFIMCCLAFLAWLPCIVICPILRFLFCCICPY